ncbi:proline--tRNA ligase [Elusimicrobiota bacterium]
MTYSRKLSRYFLPTIKEDPKEAEIPSHRLMIRAGLIRKLAAGIYEFLPFGWRVVKKIEGIIREEMDSIGGQELMMSAMQPKDLWDEKGSGRWCLYGPELMRIKDRNDREFCLGPTHEEVITYLVNSNIKSYKELPLLLYQFQMKFRDELRPRFGIMRAREFYMKDAYSFDTSMQACQKSYDDNFNAYKKIFERCGLKFVAVEADTGNIGGKSSHEFMVIADTGEEEIAVCECGYGANKDLARYKRPQVPLTGTAVDELMPLEEVETPQARTVEEVSGFLKEKPDKFIKSLLFETNPPGMKIMALVRGDHEINERFLKEEFEKVTGKIIEKVELADEQTIENATGAPVGFSGPVGLKGNEIAAINIIADKDVSNIVNAISGANKKDYHLKNINFKRDYNAHIADIRKVEAGDMCPECGEKIVLKRGIEVGHTFLLGTKYSDSMGAVFTDENGVEKKIIMGCYGIGVTRVVAAAIEQCYDENGIIWPEPISPFDVVLIQLSDKTQEICMKLYDELKHTFDVLWDDRDERPGVKFKDAMLIGIPIQIVIGKRYIEDGHVEVQFRKTQEKIFVKPEKIKEIIKL